MRELLKNRLFVYLFIPLLVILLAVALFFAFRDPKDVTMSRKFPFVSKRVFVEEANDILINFVPLRTDLREYIGTAGDDRIGLYFEYLPSGVSIGVDNDYTTNIASLLKVPLVMAVYKQIELGTLKKDQQLTIEERHLDNRSGQTWKKGAGSKITVEEAIQQTLQESDNTTSNVLLDNIPPSALADVFDYLDMPKEKEKQSNFVVISPKYYSSVLRSLYLSAYLKQENSNEILDILTKTSFKKQIQAGVDPSVKVAHKFGEYNNESAELRTHSDCGIVYVPKRPYILCLMTNATREEADKYMAAISKKIYEYVSSASSLTLDSTPKQ